MRAKFSRLSLVSPTLSPHHRNHWKLKLLAAIGGQALTVVSSAGGEAFTLATDGIGALTTVAGSVYTVATGEIAAATSQIGSVICSRFSEKNGCC